MDLCDFYSTLHAVLLYDRDECTVLQFADSSDWQKVGQDVDAFISNGQ